MQLDENDDIGADIAAAMATVAGGGSTAPADDAIAPPAPAAESAPAPAADGPARDATGKFAPKADAPDAAKPAAPDKPADQAAAQAPAGTAAPADAGKQTIAPPANWKGAGKVAWDKLPEPIRKELSEDYAQRDQMQARLGRLDAVLGPREQVLAATYGSVEQGIQNLFAVSDMATKNPEGFVLWFAQQRGINLAQMVGQSGAPVEQAAQAPDPVMQRIGHLEGMLTNFVQQQQQGTQAQTQSEIERFASDPAHPYFNDVRADMGVLIQAGRVKDMQQAYDMAVWAHPEIRQTLIDGQIQQKTAQQSQTAQQAQAAAVSISGSPAGARVASDEPDETLEQTLQRAQRQFRS